MKNQLLAIQLTTNGLKCDAPGCDYQQPGPKLTNANILYHIGTPCPKCGASLLTSEDAFTTIWLRRMVFGFNVIAFPFMVLYLPVKFLRWLFRRDNDRTLYHAHFNGTGVATIERADKP